MVVGLGRLGPPLVDGPAVAFGDDVALGVGDVLGKEPVVLGLLAEERERPAVPGDSRQPGMDKCLPEIGVEGDVPELTGPRRVGDVRP